jgi:hypothetical protein
MAEAPFAVPVSLVSKAVRSVVKFPLPPIALYKKCNSIKFRTPDLSQIKQS